MGSADNNSFDVNVFRSEFTSDYGRRGWPVCNGDKERLEDEV
jgi:hypothetical protein